MNKAIAVLFLVVGCNTFAQDINTCQFNERFSQDNYFYASEPQENLTEKELKEKLVRSIFSLIKTESNLELTNKDGESTSRFMQQSIVKSEAFLINPKRCQKIDGTWVIFVEKNQFNSSFLSSYFSDIVLLKNRISDLQSSGLSRTSKFLEEDVISIKKEFERIKFFLPFANSISNIEYDTEIQGLYKSLTALEIFTLSVEDRILDIEKQWLHTECKEALQQVSSILSENLTKQQKRRLKKVKKNIENACSIDYKKDLKLAKENSRLFNNLEFAMYLQTYPMNTSGELPGAREFNLETPFVTGRLNYFLGISDSGLRIGPYLRYFYVGDSFGETDKNLDFSDSFSDLGLTIRYKFIENFLQFELSVGRSINKINPIANTTLEPFNFIIVSPGFVLGSSKGLSFVLGLDYLASDIPSDYKYLTAKLGLNYSIPFNKISRNQKNAIKGKYEIKD